MKTLALGLALIFVAGAVAMAAPGDKKEPPKQGIRLYRPTPFPDVPKDHWAFQAVEALRVRGLLHGYPPVKLVPLDPTKIPPLPDLLKLRGPFRDVPIH